MLAVLALAGCADVAPWQRSKLAHPSMAAPEVSPSRAHLQAEGLGPAFLQYVASTWPRFVADA